MISYMLQILPDPQQERMHRKFDQEAS